MANHQEKKILRGVVQSLQASGDQNQPPDQPAELIQGILSRLAMRAEANFECRWRKIEMRRNLPARRM